MKPTSNDTQEIVIHSAFGTANYTAIIYNIYHDFYQYDIVFSNNQIYESINCYLTPECAEIDCREDLCILLNNSLRQNLDDFNLRVSKLKSIK